MHDHQNGRHTHYMTGVKERQFPLLNSICGLHNRASVPPSIEKQAVKCDLTETTEAWRKMLPVN